MFCHALFCHAMLCHALFWHALSCSVVFCHAMFCHALFCHALLRSVLFVEGAGGGGEKWVYLTTCVSCVFWSSIDEHHDLMTTTMFVLTAILARSHRSAASNSSACATEVKLIVPMLGACEYFLHSSAGLPEPPTRLLLLSGT